MNKRASLFRGAVAAVALVCVCAADASAQTGERRPAGAASQTQEQQPSAAVAPPADPMANEISLLRKSLQTLNTRLRDISEKMFGPDAPTKPGEAGDERQKRIAQNLDLLSRTEQRAETMRKQLIELTEKETAFRTRMMQIDEDMRPDSIDRSLIVGSVGTTRTSEIRDTRRRVLDNERRGVESLLNQTSQSRARLEEDVRQADALVARMRMRLLPLIEKEIDKINPAQE
jgi:hypothetical protein